MTGACQAGSAAATVTGSVPVVNDAADSATAAASANIVGSGNAMGSGSAGTSGSAMASGNPVASANVAGSPYGSPRSPYSRATYAAGASRRFTVSDTPAAASSVIG